MKKRIVTISSEELYHHYKRSRRNRQICEDLFKKEPHCYYCHKEVKWYGEIRNSDFPKGFLVPTDMATLEHLYDRYDIRRYQNHPNNEDKVLACWMCNNKRANTRNQLLSQEDLQVKKELLKKRKGKGIFEPLELLVLDAE